MTQPPGQSRLPSSTLPQDVAEAPPVVVPAPQDVLIALAARVVLLPPIQGASSKAHSSDRQAFSLRLSAFEEPPPLWNSLRVLPPLPSIQALNPPLASSQQPIVNPVFLLSLRPDSLSVPTDLQACPTSSLRFHRADALLPLAVQSQVFPTARPPARPAAPSGSVEPDPVPACSAHSVVDPASAIADRRLHFDRSPVLPAPTGRAVSGSWIVPASHLRHLTFHRFDRPTKQVLVSSVVRQDGRSVVPVVRSTCLVPAAIPSVAQPCPFPAAC